MSNLIPNQFELLGETYTVETIGPDQQGEYLMFDIQTNQVFIPNGLTPEKEAVAFYHALTRTILEILQIDKETFSDKSAFLFGQLLHQFQKTKVMNSSVMNSSIIPISCKLFAKTITTIYKDGLVHTAHVGLGDGQTGVCSPDTGEIFLQTNTSSKKLSLERIEQIYYHELVHHIFNSMNNDYLYVNEDIVDNIACFLHPFEVTKKSLEDIKREYIKNAAKTIIL